MVDCPDGISEANAKRVFDHLPKGIRPDGCALDDVRTEGSRMTVRWMRRGEALEPVVVLPSSCVDAALPGKVLSALVPDSVHGACPDEVDALSALLASDSFEGLQTTVRTPEVVAAVAPTAHRKNYLPFVGLVLVVAATGGLFALRRHKARRAAKSQ